MNRCALALCACLVLAGCGGMTRAVGVLPNTTDDLARKSEAFRKAPPAPGADTAPAPGN